MGIFLLIVLVISIIAALCSKADNDNFFDYWKGGLVIGAIIGGVLCTAALAISYKTYVNAKAFSVATQRQYKDAVRVYDDVIRVNYVMMRNAITDFTGQAFAKEVSVKIEQFRQAVTKYNTMIVSKQVMGRNPMFYGIVVMPDPDMKIIELKLE